MLRLIKQHWKKVELKKNIAFCSLLKEQGIWYWYYIQWIEEEKKKKISYFKNQINIIRADNFILIIILKILYTKINYIIDIIAKKKTTRYLFLRNYF